MGAKPQVILKCSQEWGPLLNISLLSRPDLPHGERYRVPPFSSLSKSLQQNQVIMVKSGKGKENGQLAAQKACKEGRNKSKLSTLFVRVMEQFAVDLPICPFNHQYQTPMSPGVLPGIADHGSQWETCYKHSVAFKPVKCSFSSPHPHPIPSASDPSVQGLAQESAFWIIVISDTGT